MSKLSNMLLMIRYLQTGKKYGIKELSEKLEVSDRMVRMYKEEIEKAGIYIDTIRGPYGGYVLNQSVKLPVQSFNKSDYEFLEKLNVNEKEKKNINLIVNKIKNISLEKEDCDVKISSDLRKNYNILNKAIKEKKKVKINYDSYNSGKAYRVIRPYNVFIYNDGSGCAAYCELRKDLRHFDLSRITDIEMLNDKF